jgi:hypothetical protein
MYVDVRLESFDRMDRCWAQKWDVSSGLLNKARLDISRTIAQWSLMVNQLNGE